MNTGPRGSRAVAAVVVNFNAGRVLRRCLESLHEQDLAMTVVVDNGSTDTSRRVAAESAAQWIDTGSNLGYGAAANLGVSAIVDQEVEHLLICNPDLDLMPGAVQALVDRLKSEPSLALVGPRIENPDGTLYPSARTFPDMVDAIGHGLLGQVFPANRFTRRYRLLDWDHAEPAGVDWVSGACFLVRRDAFDSVGGFDPSYFMYMEDVDLCWRLHNHGWGVGYEPGSSVVHAQGVSANQHPYRMQAAHHQSMWRFAWRTTEGAKRAALPIVAAGLAGRLIVAAVRHRFAGSTGGPAQIPLP